MSTDELIRDLAKTAGCDHELSDAEVRIIRQKLANAFIDDVLDTPEQVPVKETPNDG